MAISRISPASISPLCPRCGLAPETVGHLCWDCSANATLRAELDANVPGDTYPVGLPACLTRCGLVPSTLDGALTTDKALHIQNYLLRVNAVATTAVADDTQGKPARLHLNDPFHCQSLIFTRSL